MIIIIIIITIMLHNLTPIFIQSPPHHDVTVSACCEAAIQGVHSSSTQCVPTVVCVKQEKYRIKTNGLPEHHDRPERWWVHRYTDSQVLYCLGDEVRIAVIPQGTTMIIIASRKITTGPFMTNSS